jgi:hypothetical protein
MVQSQDQRLVGRLSSIFHSPRAVTGKNGCLSHSGEVLRIRQAVSSGHQFLGVVKALGKKYEWN